MPMTPWGPSQDLRSRRLAPGPRGSREDTARNQRERLMGATVAVVADLGYDATRVADILQLAGVSRSAFYQHFDDKHECFLATVDGMIEMVHPAIATHFKRSGDSLDERLRAVFETVVKLTVAQPAAARVWFVEVYSAGPEAMEKLERLDDRLEALASKSLAASPALAKMPRKLVRAMLGGLRQIVHSRLRHDRDPELFDLVPDLIGWVLGYRTPSKTLRRPRKAPELPPGSPNPDEQCARIIWAVTELVAEKGYRTMTITEIAQRAGVSLSTFYANYANKSEVFLAAIEDGERRLREVTRPAYAQATDWPHAVKDGLHALFAFLATHSATARLGGFDVYTGGPQALDHHEASHRSFQTLLAAGYRDHPDTPPIVGEAISRTVSAAIYQHLRRGSAERLYEVAPMAVFITLAPFMGSERATEIANEGWEPAPAA
jgi:AcrR family transcriptional regulator